MSAQVLLSSVVRLTGPESICWASSAGRRLLQGSAATNASAVAQAGSQTAAQPSTIESLRLSAGAGAQGGAGGGAAADGAGAAAAVPAAQQAAAAADAAGSGSATPSAPAAALLASPAGSGSADGSAQQAAATVPASNSQGSARGAGSTQPAAPAASGDTSSGGNQARAATGGAGGSPAGPAVGSAAAGQNPNSWPAAPLTPAARASSRGRGRIVPSEPENGWLMPAPGAPQVHTLPAFHSAALARRFRWVAPARPGEPLVHIWRKRPSVDRACCMSGHPVHVLLRCNLAGSSISLRASIQPPSVMKADFVVV